MTEPTPDDVEQIIRHAQSLDETKQSILADIRARGEDPDETRVIVSQQTADGEYIATELMRPRWMNGQQPDA
jgi:hypothetical protein